MRSCSEKLAAVLAACLTLLVVPLGAATIISTIGPIGGFSNSSTNPFAAEASWSQTGTFTNVRISAEIDPGGSSTVSHTFSGNAFLTTKIGPGTTAANE